MYRKDQIAEVENDSRMLTNEITFCLFLTHFIFENMAPLFTDTWGSQPKMFRRKKKVQ